MSDLIRKPESIWKKLTRLFRSGPIIRHKIASGEIQKEPAGTARAYKKELSSLYVHSMASYGQYERMAKYGDYCLTGDTLIGVNLPERVLTIKEIFQRVNLGEKIFVFSYDHKNNSTVCAPVSKVFENGEKEIWEVTLDDGSIVNCTDNHPFLLRDGNYKRADQLELNEALMPFHRKDFKSKKGSSYRWIYSFSRGWKPEHLLVKEMECGPIDKNFHIHHINFKQQDNRLENLKIMDAREHLSYHAKINNERFSSDITLKRWLDGDLRQKQQLGNFFSEDGIKKLKENRINFNKTFKPGRFNSGRTDQKDLQNANADKNFTIKNIYDLYKPGMTLENISSLTNKGKFKILKRLSMAGYKGWTNFVKNYTNHKIISVKKTNRKELVYDLEIPIYHNFGVCNKEAKELIFLHNSEMEHTPEISSAIDIYADEVTAVDEKDHIVKINSKNATIKKTLETLMFDVLNIEFNAYSWVRNLCKFGDMVLFVDASEGNGILNLLPIPINEIEREEGYDQKDPFSVRFRWLTQGNKILENWQVIHFRLLGNEASLPYGQSIVESARRIWRQLILIEDAMLVYRIVRSPERRVFYIDVGNIPPNEVENFMEQIKNRLRRNQIVDPSTGRVDLRYNPLPVHFATQIALLDGRTITIKELAKEFKEGKENWVYSIQDKTLKVVPGKVKWCGKNYTCNNIHRVWLDDDTYIDTAPEHPFVMRDGTSKRADKLVSGDSLMSVYRDLNNKGYERLVEPNGDLTSTHVMVARDVHKQKWDNEKQPIVHHKMDLGAPDKRNNNPNRLDVMNFWEHRKFHQKHVELTLNTPARLEERRIRKIKYNKSLEKRIKTSEQNKFYKKAEKMAAAYNGTELHKEHNTIRKTAQLESWAKNKKERSDALTWIIPNSVVEFAFEEVKHNFKIGREELSKKIRNNKHLIEDLIKANSENKRDVTKFHVNAIISKLIKNGFLTKNEYGSFKQFALTNNVPLNHQVKYVEILNEIDDVYCMTVVGPNDEDDRHNFAVVSDRSNSFESPKSLILLLNSVDEDYYIPIRDTRSSKIDTLSGGQFLGDIDDVQYIQGKLFAALKVPKAYLSYEGELSSKATLAQQDVRFSRTIGRIQRTFIAELNKICIIHLFLLGYRNEDLTDFEIKMASSSTIARQQKLELWRTELEIVASATEGVLDRETVYTEIMGFSTEQIEKIKEGKRQDKLEDLLLEAMQLPPDEQPAAGSPETTQTPEEQQLPQTLGASPGENAEQNQQLAPESVQHEKKNPGSEGEQAEISVNKGKDLFSTGEDAYELVFGTKKQTASDPGDLRTLRKVATRPFGENNNALYKYGLRSRSDFFNKRIDEEIEKADQIEKELKEDNRSFSCKQQIEPDDDI